MWRSENKKQEFLGLALVLAGVLCRLLPHPENFTPVTALAIFSGLVLTPAVALSVPLLIMMASDLWIGPHSLIFLTWGSFFAATLIGIYAGKKPGAFRVFLGTIAGSVLFFVVTNLGVFLFQDMYPKDLSGLVECYVMALPFFRNSILGDLFYIVVFFSSFVILRSVATKNLKHGEILRRPSDSSG